MLGCARDSYRQPLGAEAHASTDKTEAQILELWTLASCDMRHDARKSACIHKSSKCEQPLQTCCPGKCGSPATAISLSLDEKNRRDTLFYRFHCMGKMCPLWMNGAACWFARLAG